MSGNVIISEVGIGRKFDPVTKLQINNQDESRSLWVAEAAVNVGDVNITDNGMYSAV